MSDNHIDDELMNIFENNTGNADVEDSRDAKKRSSGHNKKSRLQRHDDSEDEEEDDESMSGSDSGFESESDVSMDERPSRPYSHSREANVEMVNFPYEVMEKIFLTRDDLKRCIEHPRVRDFISNCIVRVKDRRSAELVVFRIIDVSQTETAEGKKITLELVDPAGREKSIGPEYVSSHAVQRTELDEFNAEMKANNLATPELLRLFKARAKQGWEPVFNDQDAYLVSVEKRRQLIETSRPHRASHLAELHNALQIANQNLAQHGESPALLDERINIQMEIQRLEALDTAEAFRSSAAEDVLEMRTKRNLTKQQMLAREAATRMELEIAAAKKRDNFARKDCRPTQMYDTGTGDAQALKEEEERRETERKVAEEEAKENPEKAFAILKAALDNLDVSMLLSGKAMTANITRMKGYATVPCDVNPDAKVIKL